MQTATEKPIDHEPKSSLSGRMWDAKLPLWLGLLLMVVMLAGVTAGAWSMITARETERRLSEERQLLVQKLEADTSAARREMQETMTRQTREVQGLFGTALAWAVRSAMLRNNLDEIDQYFGELVKNPRIALVLLADADGKVLRTTDRRFLDTSFSQHFPADLLQGADVSIHAADGNLTRLVLPIQGLTSRLGTVLLVYSGAA